MYGSPPETSNAQKPVSCILQAISIVVCAINATVSHTDWQSNVVQTSCSNLIEVILSDKGVPMRLESCSGGVSILVGAEGPFVNNGGIQVGKHFRGDEWFCRQDMTGEREAVSHAARGLHRPWL
jgi:hypothetical protein